VGETPEICTLFSATDRGAGALLGNYAAKTRSEIAGNANGQHERPTGEQTRKGGDVASKFVYLAQHVEKQQVGVLIQNTMRWRELLGKNFPIKVKASYVDEIQRGARQDAGQVFDGCAFEIEQCSGLLADLSVPGAKYVGVLVEIGYALAMGIPVVIFAPDRVNKEIVQRKMITGRCEVVNIAADAAYALARAMGSR